MKAVKAARSAPNFVSFNWIGFSVFRDEYPKTDFDKAQYDGWTGHIDATPEQIAWDNELVGNCASSSNPVTTSYTRRRCRRRSSAPTYPVR